jgi:hypothetical protein
MDTISHETIEIIEVLESESRFLVEALGRLANRLGTLTDQRNSLWRENIELKLRLDKE